MNDQNTNLLATALQDNKTIQTITLKGNDISFNGAKLLSTVLTANKTLTNLDLFDNRIGNYGLKYLGECLLTNSSLQNLDIGSNDITDEYLEEFFENLLQNNTLKVLGLSRKFISIYNLDNFITKSKYISSYFERSGHLQSLDLKSNRMIESELYSLINSLEKNTNLTFLDISDNRADQPSSKKKLQFNAANLPSSVRKRRIIVD